jgi:hypothetical protein
MVKYKVKSSLCSEEGRPHLWPSGHNSWLQNGDVLWFLWGTNWICICYVEESRPPLWYSGQSSWIHNGDVLWFLWGTNWIYVCYVEESRSPLWSSDQSSWLQIQRSGLDSQRYKIFWEVVGLEQGPFSLKCTIKELLERKSSGSGLEIREYGRRNLMCWPHNALHQQKLELISPTIGGFSVSIFSRRLRLRSF